MIATISVLACGAAFNSGSHRKIIAVAFLMQKLTRSCLFGCRSCLNSSRSYWSLRNPCLETSTATNTSRIRDVTSLGVLLVPVVCQPCYWWHFLQADGWQHSRSLEELVCKERSKNGRHIGFQNRGGVFRFQYEVELEIYLLWNMMNYFCKLNFIHHY